MANFRDIKTLQKFASALASIHSRITFKENRSDAQAEWRHLAP
mgnify:CR=1 FL=1